MDITRLITASIVGLAVAGAVPAVAQINLNQQEGSIGMDEIDEDLSAEGGDEMDARFDENEIRARENEEREAAGEERPAGEGPLQRLEHAVEGQRQ